MTYYELTIYIYGKKKPLCKALFEAKHSLDSFVDSLSGDAEIIKLGDVVFRRKDFNYAEIKEKHVR